MKKAANPTVDPQLQAEAARLAALPDDTIDRTEMPEQRDWSAAERGPFYGPGKQQLRLRPDADMGYWFKTHAQGGGYQARINQALRDHMAERTRGPA